MTDSIVSEIITCLKRLEGLFNEYQKEQEASQESNRRIIHMIDNPTDLAYRDKRKKTEALRKENERLRARLTLLEATSSSTGSGIERTDSSIDGSARIEMLTRKMDELQQREDRILNSFRRTSREFRDVCYLLTGYRINPQKDNIFQLSHMYAEQEEDRLFFEVKRDGTILLLKNEYTDQYERFITTYLEEADSFPAFLAAITLDLFKSQTQSVDLSVSMSTTVVPANITRKSFVVDRPNFGGHN